MSLADRHCVVPLPKGTPKLAGDALGPLLGEVPGWEAKDDRLVRTFAFKDFTAAMKFVNALAEVAEAEDHHPDFTVRYNRVEVSSWTHTVDGLSENDFILAAKLSRASTDERA
jgi:4a-hydroxytetrahydrobiopterin dehydratase